METPQYLLKLTQRLQVAGAPTPTFYGHFIFGPHLSPAVFDSPLLRLYRHPGVWETRRLRIQGLGQGVVVGEQGCPPPTPHTTDKSVTFPSVG